MDDNYYMKLALSEAKTAYSEKEVPIGAVVVYKDKIIGTGYNRRTYGKNVLLHAELIAIEQACNFMKDWRLEDCVMYATVEPCPMCSGAILQARMKRIVYGAKNKKAGCCGSVINLMDINEFNHKVQVTPGVLEDECSFLIKDFFSKFRKGEL